MSIPDLPDLPDNKRKKGGKGRDHWYQRLSSLMLLVVALTLMGVPVLTGLEGELAFVLASVLIGAIIVLETMTQLKGILNGKPPPDKDEEAEE